MKNSVTILMLILVLLSACTNDNDNIPQPNTGEINPEKIFKSITGELNGFDEFAYNENSCIFYKAQESGLPETMLVYVNDEEGEIFEFVYFDEQGIPEYFNINGESVYVSNVRGELCDLLILCDDGTFTTIPDIETGIDINSYWSEQHATRTSGNSNISGAMNMANRILGATNLMQGTLDMGFGAYSMLIGCSMLLPGCNIAIGATLAIGGLAAFTSGAMKVARATDLLVSDGTHTDGLYEATSNALGAASTVCNGIAGGVGKEVLNSAINEGFNHVLNTYDKRAQELEHKEAAHQTQSITLTTLGVETDIIDCSATLHGAISSTMAAGDSVGIFISEDPSAMHVIGYDETIANSGDFSFTFENLERCKSYFYRAYYYNAQQQRTFIARRGEFYIPGVQTSGYTETVDGCYDVILKAMLGEQTRNADIGICYSSDDEEPTIDSNSTELLSITNSGDYTFELCPDELPCYYRAYMVVDDDNIIYGDTKTIYADDREILIKFYHDTGGDNWERNDNWCSEKPIDEWYGVYVDDNGRVLEIWLDSNNLKGKGTLSGCTALECLHCQYNQLTSLDVSGCTALWCLHCYDNQLTSLDVSGCTALEFLHCYDNQLTSLDVSGCTALYSLDCYNNQLTSLDVSGCTALWSLSCHDNQLTSLDASGCTALERLYCENNQLTSLDVSGCTALEYLDCEYNQLTQEITGIFAEIEDFRYDVRYEYYWDGDGIKYIDHGKGWWYPGEPGRGYHGK